MKKGIQDILTMSKRCLRLSFRNPETVMGAIVVTPMMMVFIFVYLLGSGIEDRQAYVNAQVPSLIVLVLGFSAAYTAWNINSDLRNGIISRFCSMPLVQSSVLIGHVVASLVRSALTVVTVVGSAFIVGFRPEASVLDWLAISGISMLIVLFMTWIFIFLGLVAKTAEVVTSYSMIIQFLPFLSGGFAEPENLIAPLRFIFRHQPFTPIIDAIRGLVMGAGSGSDIILAAVWCFVLLLVFYVLSMHTYKRKVS